MFCNMLVIIVLTVSFTHAQETTEVIVPENKTQCITQMVQWCDGMIYPQQGAGMTMLSINYEEPSGYNRVLCSSDSDGTNCTKNGQPWFACSAENKLTYNGKLLTLEVAAQDVDDGICDTADRAFNDIFVQNLSYDNKTLKTELEKGMESFFEQMAAMQEQIDLLQKRLESIPKLPGDFWSDFDGGFLLDFDGDTGKAATIEQTDQNETVAAL